MGEGVPRKGARRGRGAAYNPPNRFLAAETEACDDGWGALDAPPEPLVTTLAQDASRSIIATNDSPDVPFDRSVNPYRGCEHGCIYCYARPSHAWLGLSPGLDFESRLFYKPEAAALLRGELARRGYRPAPLALGANTDAYQPAERTLGITRGILSVLAETRHPVTIVTKSALVERDIDRLKDLARDSLAAVQLSITTLDAELARALEPRAPTPRRRLTTIARLADAGIHVGVMVAPVIPGLTDADMERILADARDAGAEFAGYVLLRLPREVSPLFRDWLSRHRPEQADRVLGILRDLRNGADNDTRFGSRMTGQGPYAQIIARRFEVAARRLGFGGTSELRCDLFLPPSAGDTQLRLF